MQLAISTATYFSKLFTEDSFKEIKKLNINTCEVFLATFSEYESQFCDILKEKSKDLNVYSVHALTNQFEPELFNISPRTRGDAEKFFDKIMYIAKNLNAKYYTFHGPARLKKKKYTFDFEKIGKRFCELNQRACKSNVKIAYENVHWTFFNEPDFLVQLNKYCKLNTVLDIKQAMQNKQDYNKFLDVMGDSLVNVHICDYDQNGKLCMPGRGIFDFKKMFNRLQTDGYEGPVTIELYADAYNSFAEIKESVDYLCSLYPFKL